MANSIVVNVSDLYKVAKQMKNDGMDFVELTINDKDHFGGDDFIPACLSFIATSLKQSFMSVDYEEIEAVEEE